MNRRTLSMDGRSHPGAVDCWPPIQSSLSLLTASLRGPGTILVQHKQKQKFFFFPLALPFFYSTVNKNLFFFPPPTPALIGPPQQSACNAFSCAIFGDHLQTCQTKSSSSQVHDWVVYKMGVLLGSVGHRVKMHKITPGTGKERGDLEIKDFVVLQKPQSQDNRLPPPHTLISNFTMTL